MHPNNPFNREEKSYGEAYVDPRDFLPEISVIENPTPIYSQLTGDLHEFAFALEDGCHACYWVEVVAERLATYADTAHIAFPKKEADNLLAIFYMADAYNEWGLSEDEFLLVTEILRLFRESLPADYLQEEFDAFCKRGDNLITDKEAWKKCSDLTTEQLAEKFAKYVAVAG